MPDNVPNARLAVYVFLEMIALGFALEAVAAFMRGDSWQKWSAAIVMGVIFMVLGVKSGQVVTRFSEHLRLVWMSGFIVLSLYSLYLLGRFAPPSMVLNLHERLHGAYGYVVVGLFGAVLLCMLWWISGTILKARTSSSETAKPAPVQDDKPPTLLDLFKSDFPNTMRQSTQEDAITIGWKDGGETKIKSQVYMDFPAKTKFAGFYIPRPPSLNLSGDKTFDACMILLEKNAVQGAFDLVSKSTAISAGREGQMTSYQDLTFSGRVLLYHEEFLSIPQKADILKAYAARKLDVQFLGPDYLGTQVIAWHQKHDSKTTR